LTVTWRLRAAAAALILPVAIRSMSLARLMALITPTVETTAPIDDRELARWVTRVLAHLPGPWHLSCLNRSVVLYHLLRVAGRPVELCIGAKRDGGVRLAAHAWLMLDGDPYLESESRLVTRLPVLARFPDGVARSA
jgi:hypothetical protein